MPLSNVHGGCLPAAGLATAGQCRSSSDAEALGQYRSSCPWQAGACTCTPSHVTPYLDFDFLNFGMFVQTGITSCPNVCLLPGTVCLGRACCQALARHD